MQNLRSKSPTIWGTEKEEHPENFRFLKAGLLSRCLKNGDWNYFTQTSHTKNYNMPRLFLMFEGIEYDFWLLRVWIPGAVSGNCLVTNGLREVWLLCCFDVRWTCLPVLASGGDSGISKGTFALAGVYAAFFAALCTTAWCDVAGACPLK